MHAGGRGWEGGGSSGSATVACIVLFLGLSWQRDGTRTHSEAFTKVPRLWVIG